METMENRIVAAARGWLGTRFHHQGRLKAGIHDRGGVDCLGLLVGVAAELDLRDAAGAPLSALDVPDYGHLPDGVALRAALEAHLAPADAIEPGRILLLAPDGAPRHLAIVGASGTGLTLIHAYAQARRVVEHALDGWWREKVAAAFSVPEQEESVVFSSLRAVP